MITFSPGDVGVRYARILINSNAPSMEVLSIPVSGDGVTSAEAWRNQFFNVTNNDNDAADNADPDGDGVVNLLERAFNLNPTQSGSPVLDNSNGTSGLPSITTADGQDGPVVSIQYLRRKASTNSGLTYTPQLSSSLNNTGWTATTGTETVQSIDSEWERVTVEDSAAGNSKRFGRVKVTTQQ